MIIFGTKFELFLRLYQVTFFLVFAWAKIFLSYHIQMNILIYKWFCDKKKSLNNISYKKLWLNCNPPFKIRKEHVLIRYLFNKVLPYLLYSKDMVKTKRVYRLKKIYLQIFYKIVVLENFAKFTGKHLCWSHLFFK